ncbi:MAG: YggS family pyridoxal phosphate-dependent enzyme [Candidatus Omnitrophica bacterium]|nr:YggS family pyridoxal phosphate-dependent enzyme [Candidatus Omnitrophota bacterium]
MIRENVERILRQIPSYVEVVAATKKRTPSEILEAITAGIKIIGENYIQEAEKKIEVIGNKNVDWHFIGHLQKNKVKKAVRLFDMIQTLDSIELAQLLDKECKKIGKIMPVLIEINIAKESTKTGIFPDDLDSLVKEILPLENLKVMGLMTMGPLVEHSYQLRPYFREIKRLFDDIKEEYPALSDFKYLSMGMSSSFKVAIEEGANMIRLGTVIFDPRE